MPKKKSLFSQEQYRAYENILPTAKTIIGFELNMKIQNEKDVALALKNMKTGDKCTLHFDSTQRSKIDGDWSSLILIFSRKRQFSLKSLFFAYEDKQNLVRLIVETYKCLALKLLVGEEFVTPRELLVKTQR